MRTDHVKVHDMLANVVCEHYIQTSGQRGMHLLLYELRSNIQTLPMKEISPNPIHDKHMHAAFVKVNG